jgi:hypothetical protein
MLSLPGASSIELIQVNNTVDVVPMLARAGEPATQLAADSESIVSDLGPIAASSLSMSSSGWGVKQRAEDGTQS